MIEKIPSKFNIDALRCIFCGYCEEACPVDAIRLGSEYETANFNGKNFIWDIHELSKRPSLNGGIYSRVKEARERSIQK